MSSKKVGTNPVYTGEDRYEICRICGAKKKEIRGPHLKIHGITEKEYEKKYFTKEEREERDKRWKTYKFIKTVDEQLSEIVSKEGIVDPITRLQTHQIMKFINRECEKK